MELSIVNIKKSRRTLYLIEEIPRLAALRLVPLQIMVSYLDHSAC